jgi:hypothetical protein
MREDVFDMRDVVSNRLFSTRYYKLSLEQKELVISEMREHLLYLE